MGFDAKKFKNTDFSTREEDVPVPELEEFFGPDEEKVWRVRNLTGIEVGRVNETGEKYKRLDAAAKAIDGTQKEKVEAFKALFGVSQGMSQETAKQTEVMVLGSVDPVCDVELAGLIRDRFPVTFANITRKIYQLTGQGAEPGKRTGSGGNKTSEQA